MAGNNRTIYGDIAPIPEPAVRKPFAEVVEPIRADWSQSNHWAFTLDKTRGWPINNTPSNEFSVAQNPALRGPPRGRGVVLTRQDNFPTAVGTSSMNLQARISLGLGGSTQQFLVDWGNVNILNLPSSITRVEAVVSGSNDDGFGDPVLGSFLQVFFSNEILPKDGYNTLTERITLSTTSQFLRPFVRGFMLENVNVDPATKLNFYAPVLAGAFPAQSFTFASLIANGSDYVHWLPSGVTSWNASGIVGALDDCAISWVLSV